MAAAALALGAGAAADTLDLLGGGTGSYAVPVVSLKEARFKATLRQQYDFSCGSAAVATLLTYHYGYPVSEQAVFEDMFARGDQDKIRREGFSLLDIKSYLGRNDFVADAFELPLAKLLESRLPALVLINEKGYQHFVVVKGLQDERVLIGDPSSGTRALSQEKFDAAWGSKLLFVIHNKQEQARFNELAEWRGVPRGPLAPGLDNEGGIRLPWPKFGLGDN
jgi:predicted double-glycine peptidase